MVKRTSRMTRRRRKSIGIKKGRSRRPSSKRSPRSKLVSRIARSGKIPPKQKPTKIKKTIVKPKKTGDPVVDMINELDYDIQTFSSEIEGNVMKLEKINELGEDFVGITKHRRQQVEDDIKSLQQSLQKTQQNLHMLQDAVSTGADYGDIDDEPESPK